jgi:hypothetical protein
VEHRRSAQPPAGVLATVEIASELGRRSQSSELRGSSIGVTLRRDRAREAVVIDSEGKMNTLITLVVNWPARLGSKP